MLTHRHNQHSNAHKKPILGRRPHRQGMLPDRFDQPIWKLEVEFERRLRATCTRQRYLNVSGILYDFFSAYPKKKLPADYFVTDVEDFCEKVRRERSKAKETLVRESLRSFFNWLRDEKGFPIQNPALVPVRPVCRPTVPQLTLAELNRLAETAVTEAERSILRATLEGYAGRKLAAQTQMSLYKSRKLLRGMYRAAGFSRLRPREVAGAFRRLCFRLGTEAAEKSLNLQVTRYEGTVNLVD